MLIYFKVANYKSIKDPVVINFTATGISEHADTHITTVANTPLLKSILLYGPNASGKTNILEAFLHYRYLITSSAKESQGNEAIEVQPFLLNTVTAKQPVFFEARFILNGVKYRYGFEADKKIIHKEWLLEAKAAKEYPVFLRIGQDIEIDGKRFANAEGLEKRTRKNVLFLSVASQWNVAKAEKINAWFGNAFTIHGLLDTVYEDFTLNMLEDEKYKHKIRDFVSKADLGIADLEAYNMLSRKDDFGSDDFFGPRFNTHLTEMERKSRAALTWHKVFDEHNKEVDMYPFVMRTQESEGTKKYFNLIGPLIKALEQNYLVVIDEFDARFHSLLSKAVIELFNNNPQSQAQLFIASHDTALLDKELLRRDQIYFVEKDGFGATQVTSLVEFKIRKEAPYDKNYLEGKFGAIPMIDNLESALKK
ncbi:AAA family ATPase [Chitinophaga eiseniae]|uniref:ATP-binding protein n=1 Tax=Chitinophaga eiseniae TaxID=634771 RepID=A0A847SKH9_9BACT|nr:ATP-binding protein [Chitinophaga eiseniae]NLR80654.1 ATP-binding protein [Chitinophaga eiseniae]